MGGSSVHDPEACVILNFKYGRRNAAEVLEEIGREILPQLEADQPAAAAASHAS
jgi:hypothetical protein